MLDKLIKEAIGIVVGKQSGEIVEHLSRLKYVNEFLIAKKMDITVNQVRNILYRLSDNGLVSSTRKKDKKKGWYTYFWKIESIKTLEFYENILNKRIEQISFQIKSRETKDFYVCERCSIEFTEENALLYDFTCNECGDIFSAKDNKKILNEFNKNLDKLKRKLKLVEEEMGKEKEKLDKKIQKEIKKQKKEKDLKRAIKRKETALKRKATLEAKKKEEKKNPSKKKKIKKSKSKKKKSAKKVKPKKKAARRSAYPKTLNEGAKKKAKKVIKKKPLKKKVAKKDKKKFSKKKTSKKKPVKKKK